MKTVELVQGSLEWHAFRKMHIGSSDAPAVLGVSPYRTMRQCAAEKIGLPQPLLEAEEEKNEFIFNRGHAVEKKIREQFKELTGVFMAPLVCVHPEYEVLAASLDGFDPRLGVLEAKLVGQAVLKKAEALGEIPEHHAVQMQHQMMVTGADVGSWFGHDGKGTGFMVTVPADRAKQAQMIETELKFWEMVKAKVLPPLTDRDYLEIENDPDMASLKELKELMDNATSLFDEQKAKVLAKLKHSRCTGSGLSIVKSVRAGNVSWQSIPEVKALAADYVEKFRGKQVESWTVRVLK